MNHILKAVAAALICGLLSTVTGCSSIPGHPLTEGQINNEFSNSNGGMGNWGWNDNNQNG